MDDEQNATSAAPTRRTGRLVLQLLGLGLAGGVLLVAGHRLAALLPSFADRVAGLGAAGALLFAAGYVIATIAFVPGSILTLAAGAIFGLVRGVAVVFAGATAGATLAFLIARYAARSAVERGLADHPRFRAIDRAVAVRGRYIVFLLRLSPLVPFNLLNYVLGLTQVRLADYVVASVGMLPGTILYVYYGKVAGDVAMLAGGADVSRGAGYYVLLAVGLLATVTATTIVTRIARRALETATDHHPRDPVE